MNLKQRIEQDLKAAMLQGNKTLVTTLRGLKSSILYAEVAASKRDQGLSDEEATVVLRKELKKRQESAELYTQGGNHERSQAELEEAAVIQDYLPAALSDDELSKSIDQAIADVGELSQQTMGQVIGKVKQLTAGSVDGARIAQAIKERLNQ
jgi:uncharacterized protein